MRSTLLFLLLSCRNKSSLGLREIARIDSILDYSMLRCCADDQTRSDLQLEDCGSTV